MVKFWFSYLQAVTVGQTLLRSFRNFNFLGIRFLPLTKKKKWEIQFCLKIGSHLPTAPGAFRNCAPKNILISIKTEPLVLDMQCW